MKLSYFLAVMSIHLGMIPLINTQSAEAAGHKIAAGATAAVGGSNPITFTSLAEYSYTYINSSRDREWIVGFSPGLGYAVRFEPTKDLSVSLGGMASLSSTLYAGPYAGFAWEFWCPGQVVCLSFDYRTSIAFYSKKQVVSSLSIVSLGGTLWSN